MSILTSVWRRVGTRLYLALAFTVVLTAVSSSVGVWYFERSVDASERVLMVTLPSQKASWESAREVDRLRLMGLGLVALSDAPEVSVDAVEVTASIQRLDELLGLVSGSEGLVTHRELVQEDFYSLAAVIDGLVLYRSAWEAVGLEADALRAALDGVGGEERLVLSAGLGAPDLAALDVSWVSMSALGERGVELSLVEDVYRVRAAQLELSSRGGELAESLSGRGGALEDSVAGLVALAEQESALALEESVKSFGQGRVVLAGISLLGMVAATLVAWFWVGQGVVQRLSRLSERMLLMAGGDIESPMPGGGQDEIGQLSDALEVWRQQSLEVRRLNLVERLYGELNDAHEELKRMQDRLVAQEKLAALGELVAGVAHEISNPLNFVQNFSRASADLYDELEETVGKYLDSMSEDDRGLVEEIADDLKDSLKRVEQNGARALEIVARMRDLGMAGGEPVASDLATVVRDSVRQSCRGFCDEWGDFEVEPVFDLDAGVGLVPLVARDFGRALGNLVQNSCYAMRVRCRDDEQHVPELRVSVSADGDQALVSVWDNGVGIGEEHLGRIFNPFYTTREGISGAGLGLPIAADVVRRLGGHITVDTEVGDHTEFVVQVPRRHAGARGTVGASASVSP